MLYLACILKYVQAQTIASDGIDKTKNEIASF